MNRIDPDGRDIWEMNAKGEIVWKEESEKHRLYSVDNNGNQTENYVEIGSRDVLDQLSANREDYVGRYSETTNNGTEVLSVFEFASKNSAVEWSYSGYEDNMYVLSTSHQAGKVQPIEKEFGHKGKTDIFNVHSHPTKDGTQGPSMMDSYNQQNINPARNSFIYHPYSDTWYKYSSRTIDHRYPNFNGVHQTISIPRPTLSVLKNK